MAFLDTGKLSLGELITASFAELAASRREVLAYLGVFLLADVLGSLAPEWLSSIEEIGSLVVFGGFFFAQYLLYRAMLRHAGHDGAKGRIHIFRFVVMAFVITIGIIFASYLFVIPAIMLAARWIAAPCYVVAADKGPISSLRESWSATRGNTLPLSLAFAALVLLFLVLLAMFEALESALEDGLGVQLALTLSLHFLPLLLMGLSVATYRRLNQEGAELAAVFA
jgi:hypothetical protein